MLLKLSQGIGGQRARAVTPASPYLDGVLDSVMFDIDATQENRVPNGGSGFFAHNLIENPAIGAKDDWRFKSQGDNFVGAPGSPEAYFDFSGNTSLLLFGPEDGYTAATQPEIIRNLHISADQPFWYAAAMEYAGTSTLRHIFGTDGRTSTNPGFGIRMPRGTHTAQILHSISGTNRQTDFNYEDTDFATPGYQYVFIVSVDPANGTVRMWINGHEKEQILAWGGAGDAKILSFNQTGNLGNNAQSKGFALSFGAEFLTGTQAQGILDHYRARHNRLYAGLKLPE